MRLQNPFSAISTTGIDSQVLTVLVRSEQYLTIREIHQLLPEQGSHQGVRLSAGRLVEQGMLIQRLTGRGYAFAFNGEHLLAAAVRQIALAKSELISRMTLAISEWQIQPIAATLFGSAARNDMNTDSDLDVFLVFPDGMADGVVDELVSAFAARVSLWTGNDLRPLIYQDFEVQPAPIFDSIVAEGIAIAGDHSWLRKRIRKG